MQCIWQRIGYKASESSQICSWVRKAGSPTNHLVALSTVCRRASSPASCSLARCWAPMHGALSRMHAAGGSDFRGARCLCFSSGCCQLQPPTTRCCSKTSAIPFTMRAVSFLVSVAICLSFRSINFSYRLSTAYPQAACLSLKLLWPFVACNSVLSGTKPVQLLTSEVPIE